MAHTVKNNHDAPLSIAGVTIAAKRGDTPGEAGIEANALRGCLNSNAVKTWISLGLIEVEGLEELQNQSAPTKVKMPGVTPPAKPDGDEKSPERLALESKASELGVKGVIVNMKDETLQAKVDELAPPTPVVPGIPGA